ncbi:MAG TPA: hypothetical protein VK810_03645 [Dongiaceae bacterium]|nr:hypothetical protein [Dongiaceae bacterium]
MNEEPKSIWKKSWKGSRGLLLSLIPFTLFFIVIYASGAVPPSLKNYLGLPAYALFFSLFATLMLLLVIKLVGWGFRRRNFKKFLFGLACLATLIALFYAEEDWRGKHDWEKYKHEWEAKGEKFDFKDFVPPPVPDDQNFAMAPIFDATRNLASRKWRNEHRNQHNDDGGNPWDTNLADPLQIDIGRIDDWPATRSTTNGSGDWQTAKASDLTVWQNYYRTLATTTNLFPVAPQPQSPPQDVLLALGKYDSVIEELRAAGARPESRFPLDYDDEDPAEILLPHLAALKRSSQVLQLRAIAELENDQSEKAFDDVKLALRLADSIRTEPFIITHLVRIAILQITLQPLWEGLAQHKWSDAQLAGLDAELSKLDFPAGYEFSVRGERSSRSIIIDWIERKRSRYWLISDMVNNNNQPNTMENFLGSVAFYLAPKGWFYQNEIAIAQVEQQWNLPMVDAVNQIISPKTVQHAGTAFESSLRTMSFNYFARLLLSGFGSFAQKTAYSQNAVNMARVAIALERYRLANGNYPDSLDAIAAQFPNGIPHDIINGEPLHYRRTDDRQFILYSVGWNETDDGGVVGIPLGGSSPKLDLGDWVWRYPQK